MILNKTLNLKTVTTFLYLLVSLPLFLFFYVNVFVWISFFVNYLLITLITNYHLNVEKTFSPLLTSYIVFNFLFFIVAPIIQISSFSSNDMLFQNFYPYNPGEVVFTNFLIILFNLLFFSGYIYNKKKYFTKSVSSKELSKGINFFTPLVILLLLILCLLIFALNFNYMLEQISKSIYSVERESVFLFLIKAKVLFLIPLGAIIITYSYLKNKRKITNNTIISFLILGVLILILIVFKNPLTEKRNALGPIYITLLYIFYPKVINTNAKFFLFSFVSMIIFFPIMSAITHIDVNLYDIVSNPEVIIETFERHGGITNTFNTLHYDAFANIMATVEYSNENGYSFGYQLLSAFFFFIPRSIWATKPISTGELIGNFLIEEYNFGYNNLSNPLVSEGYINFGIFGVCLMAVLLSFFVVKFIIWLQSSDYLKEICAFYFSVHLIFLLRGDFTNGFVYFIGTFIGIYLIPKFFIKYIKI